MVSGSMGVSGFDGVDEIYGLCYVSVVGVWNWWDLESRTKRGHRRHLCNVKFKIECSF